jgi:hypothetical protein
VFRSVRIRLGIVVTLSALTACSPAPDRALFTVDYYRAHADVRSKMLAQCVSDLGTREHEPDCVNAREAARIESIGSLKALPPMRLPTGRQR